MAARACWLWFWPGRDKARHLTLRAGGSSWWDRGPQEDGESLMRPQEKAELV